MQQEQPKNYRKLAPRNISLSIRTNPNGNLDLIVGLYEKNGWMQHIKIELIDFPDNCSSLDNFKSFAIRGV